ncbi:hypothetical protein A1O1_06951 [Capronia coronata CBS 617.96]|uniref:Fe2OG dioxygenase domain-containing protein n=1 Tax=Capronia coronata CBS 617.96 TaxID=1182541 RepID=W9Y140_9EURO|nr:uncharacterized protein A1O1_06951 [Capronia coronata CBS 617.96]EXJ83330.1 hypothetical protein A1O1_06951 [Capronia coronata CBS 617.96]
MATQSVTIAETAATKVDASVPKMDIPIINISPFLAGDAEGTAKLVADFREACTSVGFLQIVGHPISHDLQERLMEGVVRFFQLPMEQKEAISKSKSKSNRGYERIGDQKLDDDPNVTADQKEAFSIRTDKPLGRFLQGPNHWPDLPGFKESYTEYYNAMRGFSQALFRIIALSLNLDEGYFDRFASDPDGLAALRSHHYPPTPVDVTGRTRGAGAHTDFGALTLLLQDDVGGLEVLHRASDTWHPVTPVEGAYVMNIGDLLERWTNGHYKSTMHRVLSPLSLKDRYTCAYFNEGELDQVIECIPTCLAPGEKPLYPPIKVQDHLLSRWERAYTSIGTTFYRADQP